MIVVNKFECRDFAFNDNQFDYNVHCTTVHASYNTCRLLLSDASRKTHTSCDKLLNLRSGRSGAAATPTKALMRVGRAKAAWSMSNPPILDPTRIYMFECKVTSLIWMYTCQAAWYIAIVNPFYILAITIVHTCGPAVSISSTAMTSLLQSDIVSCLKSPVDSPHPW